MRRPKIKLTSSELLHGSMIGVMRHCDNIRKGLMQTYGAPINGYWQRFVEGSLAELALAKYLNVYHSGVGERNAPDVGGIHDVRQTDLKNGRLTLHPAPRDKPERPFWLAIGLHGEYELAGWLWGYEGMLEKYWTDPGTGRPAFFVPQEDLHDPYDLPVVAHENPAVRT